MPKISIIIPIYSAEKYIERCARSLFEQTLDSLEYIFIDDCSPDNSIPILKNVLKEYPHRIKQTRIVTMPTNSGQAAVRRHGIQLALGDYIIHCDSDDWVELNMYEDMYNIAIDNDCDIVICDFFKSTSIYDNHHLTQQVSENRDKLIGELINETTHSSLCNKLVSKNLYRNNIIYPQYNMLEDLALTLQLVYYANKIKYINKPYYHYFTNHESITHNNESNEKKIERGMHAINNCRLIYYFMEINGIFSQYYSEINAMKFRWKRACVVMTSTKVGRVYWRRIFKGIDFKSIFFTKISYKDFLIYFIASIGLYNVFKKSK